MSTKQFLGLLCVLLSAACGGTVTTANTQNSGGGGGGGGGGSKPPVPAKLGLRINPNGTRTGTALSTQPVVEVQDANGNIVTSGSYAVTAAIASGGGSLGGTTNVASANGVATFTDLVVNGTTGARTLVFSTSGLQSVTSQSFTLTSQLLKSMAVLTTPSTTAQTMIALTQQPVFQLLDEANQPYLTPTPVTATIAQGNAIVASGGTVTSDANGKVTFTGLTLGALNGLAGTATLRFTAAGLSPGDFSVALSCVVYPLTFGNTLSGTLAAGDCTSGGGNLIGRYIRTYGTTLSAMGAAVVTMTSNAYHPWACVRSQTGTWGWCTGGTSQAATKALLNAGAFYAIPSTDSIGQVGAFTIGASSSGSDISSCEFVLALFTGSISQNLTSNDCTFSDGTHYDDFMVPVAHGEGFITTITAGFPIWVGVYLDSGYVTTNSGFSAQVRYTNNAATPVFAQLVVTGLNGGQLGPYTFQHAMQYPAPDRAPIAMSTTFGGWAGMPGPTALITRTLPKAPPRRQ